MKNSADVFSEPIHTCNREKLWPLTPAEEGMRIEQKFNPSGIAYNINQAFELNGTLDESALENALKELIKRHRILRSYYPEKEGEFFHRIADEVEVTLAKATCEANELQKKIDELNIPYDLEKAPLFRFTLFQTQDAQVLNLGFHHIIMDGFSVSVLVNELAALYAGQQLTEIESDYLDYAACLGLQDNNSKQAFFETMFADGLPETEMPTRPVRPDTLPQVDSKEGMVLDAKKVDDAAKKLGITSYCFLFAAIGMVMGKYCGSEDVVLGAAMSGRTDQSQREMAGMFVNALPVRVKPVFDLSFGQYAKQVADQIAAVKENQDYPLEKIVNLLASERSTARAPLFDVIVNYLNDIPAYQAKDMTMHPLSMRPQALAYDFQIEMRKRNNDITIDLYYSQTLYLPEVAQNFIEQLNAIIQKVCVTPSMLLIDASEIPEQQKRQILYDFAGEETEGDGDATVVSLFRKRAKELPKHPAVSAKGNTLTYAQLDEITDNLAGELSRRKITSGDCVGVMVGRSEMMPICALGVLKSGAAYLPMDSSYPAERLEYMLGDAGVTLVIADRELAHCVPGFQGDFLYSSEIATLPKGEIPKEPGPQDLMVLLYTSGTTGNPKGVMLCQENLTHFCAWYRRAYHLTKTDGVAAYASFGFDACLMDMYPTLTAGAHLHIIPNEMRLDLDAINTYIEDNKITVAFFTTQLGRQFAESMENASLRALSVGGEALVPIEPPKDFNLFNLYGPTECTVLVTRQPVDKQYERVPIGRAIDNIRLYVLDRHDRLAPVGVSGELCIAGRGVAKGYLNRPDITEEKFTPNPFTTEEKYARIYRSGDVVRFLPDGAIDFVGRKDFQIKIRGFRVELTEIEGRIREYPMITDAAVVAQDAPAGGKCAVAYLVAKERVDIEKLNLFIEEKLPPYMIPSATMQVESIPLNPNGKVDRRKLPPPVFGGGQEKESGAIKTDLGRGICNIIAEVLGHEEFAQTDSLLRVGLTSLSAIKLATKLEKCYRVALPVKDLLQEPTALAIENKIVHALLKAEPRVEDLTDLAPVSIKTADLTAVADPRSLSDQDLSSHLKAVIEEVLGTIEGKEDENLNKAGLTSLSTIKLVSRLKKHFGVAPKVHELLECATPNKIKQALLRESEAKTTQQEEIVEEQAGYPLSGSQLGVYLDCLKRPDALLYNIPVRVEMPRGIDGEKLRAAVAQVLDAHPAIKMRIFGEGEETQQIPTDVPAHVTLLNMTKKEAQEYAEQFARPFDLAKGPLYRAEVIAHEGEISLFADFHHIAFDGASLDLFLHDLAAAYEGLPIEKEQLTCFQAAILEQRREGSEEWLQDKQYFDRCLKKTDGASEIPCDLPNPSGISGRSREVVCVVDRKKAETFCMENGYTPAGLFFAATAYVVSRLTGQDIAALSTVSSGRSDLRLQNSFGMFVRTLPLTLEKKAKQTVQDYILAAQESLRGSMLHEQYPYAQIAADYGFFPSIMYACEIGIVAEHLIEGKPVTLHSLELASPKFNISVHIEERNGEFVVSVQYDDARYTSYYMEQFVQSIAAAFEHMVDRQNASISTISILSDAQQRMVDGFSEKKGVNVDATLHGLFETAAKKTPDLCALMATDGAMTYQELDQSANALANALIKRGVTHEDRVAFMLPRTKGILVAMLGILKAGGCYVPLDTNYPKARIEQIMQDCDAKCLITTDEYLHLHERAETQEALCENSCANRPNVEVSPNQLAYMIYTSGSTGKPKGVMIEHASIANYVTAHPDNRHVWELKQHATRMMSITTVTFDMFLKESMTVLCNNLTLVLADDESTHDPVKLAELFEKTGADAFNATPSRMMEYTAYPALLGAIRRCKVVMAGAEKYPPMLAERLFESQEASPVLLNTYGPTETTVSCNAKRIERGKPVTVGAPLMNVHEFIVDCDGNKLPPCVAGELYIGGKGVARGYLNLPEQTEKQFVSYEGLRVYRSGDLAKWTAQGEIEILGRRDNQMKLRGLRIEPGEVEEALQAIDSIIQAVVTMRKINGADQLCAYYTARSAQDPVAVRDILCETLASYMIPTAYAQLEAIPLNQNGKTDLKALPEPKLLRINDYVAPADDTEQAFCALFAEVLETDCVGAEDSFFDIGGTSLSVTRVVIGAKERGLTHKDGTPVSYGDVFSHATPRALAQLIQDDGQAVVPVEQEERYDYTKIDKLLSQNKMSQIFREEPVPSTRIVLLTGATGYLGSHVLKALIDEPRVEKIYCILRKGRTGDVQARLKQMLFYYFEDSFEDCMGKKVIAVEGDITNVASLDALKDEGINTVMNCAANVSHFASDNSIFEVNAQGVKNLIAFCLKVNAQMTQISTASIAGFSVDKTPPPSMRMTEQMLYFNQNLDNQYVHSKFLAERAILEAVAQNGLHAKIMRVGNLMARNMDGEFQINASANSFIGNLRAYQVIGCFPYSSYLHTVELAPIDSTTQALMLLMDTPEECRVFHPFNHYTVYLGDIIMAMKAQGFRIELVEDDLFAKAFSDAMKDKSRAELLTNFIAYQNMAKGKTVLPISADNSYTTQMLLRKNWRWPKTGEDYMNKFIKDLVDMGYFD